MQEAFFIGKFLMNAKTCKKMRKFAKKLAGDGWKILYKKWKKEVRNAPNP